MNSDLEQGYSQLERELPLDEIEVHVDIHHEWKWDWIWEMVFWTDWFYMVNYGYLWEDGEDGIVYYLHVRILGIRSLWKVKVNVK